MRDEMPISITEAFRARLNEEGHINLKDKQVAMLQRELEEYGLHQESALAVGPNAVFKAHYKRIEKSVSELIRSFRDLDLKLSSSSEPFDDLVAMNDEILFGSTDVDERQFLRELLELKTYLETERIRKAPGGRPREIWLGSILDNVASLYIEAGGQSLAVSGHGGERRSIFINFVWTAMELLPKRCRPHSKQSLAAYWEKHRIVRQNRVSYSVSPRKPYNTIYKKVQ